MIDSANTGWGAPPVAESWSQPTEVEVPEAVKYDVLHKSQPETEDPEHFRLRRNAEIEHWLNQKATAVQAVELERDHRTKVTATLFPVPTKGTQRYELGGGYKVKLVHTLAYSIGNKDAVDEDGSKVSVRKQVEALEARVAELGEPHRILFEQLVSWNPEISGSQYEKLNKDDPIHIAVRSAIDELLTIKPGSPQLTFEPPKEAN